jgi:hypothetical protein
MPLVILHYLLNVSVQLANKRGFKQKKICLCHTRPTRQWLNANVDAKAMTGFAESAITSGILLTHHDVSVEHFASIFMIGE